jgi:hypothetical protein
MRIIEKYRNANFQGFSWLNFDSLPKSDGYKFEAYMAESDDTVTDLILIFYALFKPLVNDIIISDFKPDGKWGDFCIDTWDIQNDRYDYSPDNKKEPTASYLKMLIDCEIEPTYPGFCKCLDWDKFLHITLQCVTQHTAPYSMMFYVPDHEFVFYFHHTGSLGIYYKKLNRGIRDVIKKAQEENMEIKNFSDDRLRALF